MGRGEELEVVVELVMLDEGISLIVNGVQTRQDPDALERALLNAFRNSWRFNPNRPAIPKSVSP